MARSEPTEESLTALVRAALDGDDRAWVRLVGRVEGVVWKAVIVATSDPEIREEAAAAAWLAVARSLRTLRDPEYLPGWLWTIATNEVTSIARQRQKERTDATDSPGLELAMLRRPGSEGDSSTYRLDGDEHSLVRAAFDRLKPKCRELLTLLVMPEEPPSYATAAVTLGQPIGGLGPNRRRCLDQLRRTPEIQRIMRERGNGDG